MPVETEFYDRLGVPPDATLEQIRKGYRVKAMKYHPDKNPDPAAAEKFKECNEAYEVLSDEQKRAAYDRYGKDAFSNEGPSPGPDIGEIFKHMFRVDPFGDDDGDDGHGRGGRTENIAFELVLTLEELYNGCTKKKEISKHVLCDACDGKGHKNTKKKYSCHECRGAGVKVVIGQFGPMMTRQQVRCDACGGEGEVIPAKDRCSGCGGKKVVKTKKVMDIEIEKGFLGDKIVFRREASEIPGMIPGDVIFVIKQEPHSVFKRDGIHLEMEKEVSLANALTGFQFIMKHLDGREIVVQTPPGDIIKPGDSREIRNEGMPVHTRPYEHGNLYIKFKVQFPSSISKEQAQTLQKIFPDFTKPPVNKDNSPVVLMAPVDHDERNNERGYDPTGNSESDDEGGYGHQGVPCSQQ